AAFAGKVHTSHRMRNGPGDCVRRGRRYDFKRPLGSAFPFSTLATFFQFQRSEAGSVVSATTIPSVVIIVVSTAIVPTIVAMAVVLADVAMVADGAGAQDSEAPVGISARALNDDVAVCVARPTLVDRIVLFAFADVAPDSVVGATVRGVVVGAVVRTRAG